MTEAEWEACTEPRRMLEFVSRENAGRKRTLFCAACCRRIWHLLKEPASREAVELIEEDASVRPRGLQPATYHAASEVSVVPREISVQPTAFRNDWEREQDPSRVAAAAATLAVGSDAVNVFDTAASAEAIDVALTCASCQGEITATAVQLEAAVTWKSIWEDASAAAWDARRRASYLGALRAGKRAIQAAQADLLKDLFGNPFRQVQVDRSWLEWNGAVVPRLAETLFEQRSFAGLPILADALEEAGCTDAAILRHCRQRGEHVRGCWVVDILLGNTFSHVNV